VHSIRPAFFMQFESWLGYHKIESQLVMDPNHPQKQQLLEYIVSDRQHAEG
jgi:hypothetical protein